jgi:hypothetical protein
MTLVPGISTTTTGALLLSTCAPLVAEKSQSCTGSRWPRLTVRTPWRPARAATGSSPTLHRHRWFACGRHEWEYARGPSDPSAGRRASSPALPIPWSNTDLMMPAGPVILDGGTLFPAGAWSAGDSQSDLRVVRPISAGESAAQAHSPQHMPPTNSGGSSLASRERRLEQGFSG